MRPESRLLGILADPYPDAPQQQEARRLLSRKLDWNFILKQARKEGVLGLIFYHGKNGGLGSYYSEDVREESRQAYYRYAARNTFLSQKIKPLCEFFRQGQVPLMMLKGLALCHDIYPNPALRPVTDVDLLVKKQDRARAEELLREAGFRFVFESSRQLHTHHRAMNSSFYTDADGAFSVHLHWHLINNSWPVDIFVDAVDMDDIWIQARPLLFDGIEVLSLAPHHLLLFLSLHAFLHGSEHLIWLSDIAAAKHKYGLSLDQGLVRGKAREWGLSFIFPEMLSLTGRIIGKEPPIFLKNNTRSCLLSYVILFFLHKGLRRKFRFLYQTKMGRFFASFRPLDQN